MDVSNEKYHRSQLPVVGNNSYSKNRVLHFPSIFPKQPAQVCGSSSLSGTSLGMTAYRLPHLQRYLIFCGIIGTFILSLFVQGPQY
jgi:hypothetical protein